MFISRWITDHEVDLVNCSLDVCSQLILGKGIPVKGVACSNDLKIMCWYPSLDRPAQTAMIGSISMSSHKYMYSSKPRPLMTI